MWVEKPDKNQEVKCTKRKKKRQDGESGGGRREGGGRKAAMNEIMGQRFVTGSILRNIEKNYFVL